MALTLVLNTMSSRSNNTPWSVGSAACNSLPFAVGHCHIASEDNLLSQPCISCFSYLEKSCTSFMIHLEEIWGLVGDEEMVQSVKSCQESKQT